MAPLTDLVQRFGARCRLEDRMLLRVDGQVIAIAFMQKTQNFVYPQDLFGRHRVAEPPPARNCCKPPPRSRPVSPAWPTRWHRVLPRALISRWRSPTCWSAWVGQHFEPGTSRPIYQRDLGVMAAAPMRSLMPLMTPNALAANTDDVMHPLKQGRAAMGLLWASRAARMDDPMASKVVGKMAFAAAPSVLAVGPPAAHLWRDGVVLPRNGAGGAARREVVFQVLMEMLGEQSLQAGDDLAIWVRSAYRPGRFGSGVGTGSTSRLTDLAR